MNTFARKSTSGAVVFFASFGRDLFNAWRSESDENVETLNITIVIPDFSLEVSSMTKLFQPSRSDSKSTMC